MTPEPSGQSVQPEMPPGYELIKRGMLRWGWVAPDGYSSMDTKWTAKGAAAYAWAHYNLMVANDEQPA